MNPFRLFLPLVLIAFALPASAQEARRISGTASYLARIALPPEAEIAVEATGFNGESLRFARRPTDGAQVPLPFALDIPGRLAAKVRVAVFNGGQALWVSDTLSVAPGADPVDLGRIVLEPWRPMGFASTFDCGGVRLKLGFAGDKALLKSGARVVELEQIPAASGARFAAADGSAEVWTKGDTATITLEGTALEECRMVPPDAARRWVARGNEPGWTLTIADGRLAFQPFGGAAIEARMEPPHVAAGAFVYDLAEGALRVTVADTLCRDSMTGMPHPQTVTVDTGGQRLTGCGGQPMDLLAGPEWVVEDVQQGGIIDSSRITVLVTREGRISGSGGCNRYTGGLTLSGEGVDIGPVASTQMACAPALMQQEQRFFGALATVDGFDIAADGALVLTSAGAPVITARR